MGHGESMKTCSFFLGRRSILPAVGFCFALAQSQPNLTLGGGAQVSLGRIEASSDTSTYHYSGNRLMAAAAQLNLRSEFGERLAVSVGMGIIQRHYPLGSIGNNGGRTPFLGSPTIINADFTYAWWNSDQARLALTGGYFPFTYNSDIKNLGLYLLRGPVYPGILISGFETKHTKPVANTLGIDLHHRIGGFEQHFLVNCENELYPLFDLSPAYIASMRFGEAFKMGAGINFYHLLPISPKLTSPDSFAYDGSDLPSQYNGDPNTRTWIYVDTVMNDTTYLSFRGTKLMAYASFDPKAFFSSNALGPEDLRLYGEIALIGLDRSKAYRRIYGSYVQRMPVLIGFNLPAFHWLDHLSLEVEWYGSRVKDDLARYQSTTGAYHSPLPVENRDSLNLVRDDWKWSLHAQKTLGQVRLSGQVANDHSRSGGTLTSPGSEWQAFFNAPKDWYWMLKAGFFF